MRRFLGVIPLLAYLLATLATVGIGLIFVGGADSLFQEDAGLGLGEGFIDILGEVTANILVIPIFLVACIPLLMFIFKLIHLITRARFCGIICVLIDVLVTVALFVAAFSTPDGGFITVIAAAELVCCLCNVASLAG